MRIIKQGIQENLYSDYQSPPIIRKQDELMADEEEKEDPFNLKVKTMVRDPLVVEQIIQFAKDIEERTK